MRVRVFHGFPPREISGEAGSSPSPFFGIVPRSLLADVSRNLTAPEWLTVAAELECAAAAGRPVASGSILKRWRRRYDRGDVISWRASRDACLRYLERLLSDTKLAGVMAAAHAGITLEDPRALEWHVWQVKEGHTSSVWKAVATTPAGHEFALCINLARDRFASLELRASAAWLRRWHATDPDHVAFILHNDVVEVRDGSRSFRVQATAGPWIDGRELHVRWDDDAEQPTVVEVEAFVDGGFGGHQAMLGRALARDEVRAVLRGWRDFLLRHTAVGSGSRVARVPPIDFADGDLVATRAGIMVVASGASPVPMPIEAWLAFAAVDDPVEAFACLAPPRTLVVEGGS